MKTEETKETENNYAFIDSQNLNLGIKSQGWNLDFAKFRIYLDEKYQVKKAYLFIGYVKGNESLYTYLQNSGYFCIFKPSLELKDGTIKGNVDAELVLHTMIQLREFRGAVIVSGDGDFACLVEYLIEQRKMARLIVPNQKKYSALLKKKSFLPFIRFASDLKTKVEKIDIEADIDKEKAPIWTKP